MTDTKLEYVTVENLLICTQCLDGEGGECHTPGCVFIWNRAPDLSLRDNLAMHGAKTTLLNGKETGPWVTIQEAAKLMHRTERTIYRFIDEGKIDAHKVGRKWLIPTRYVYMPIHEMDEAASFPELEEFLRRAHRAIGRAIKCKQREKAMDALLHIEEALGERLEDPDAKPYT